MQLAVVSLIICMSLAGPHPEMRTRSSEGVSLTASRINVTTSGLLYVIGMPWKSTGRHVASADTASVSDDGGDFSKSIDDSDGDGRTRRISSFSRVSSLILTCSIRFDVEHSEPALEEGGRGGSDRVMKTRIVNRGSFFRVMRCSANHLK